MAYIFKLSQQQDVAISSPTNLDILQYNSSTGKWENHALSALALFTLTVGTTAGNLAIILDSGTTYNPGTAARTISHETSAGYKHLPANTTATNWLKGSATDGLGVWTAPATLTTSAAKGLKIGTSTTGTYDINTTKEIEVDFTQVQALLTNPVTGTGADTYVAYFSGTSAITGEAAFAYNASTNTLSVGNIVIDTGGTLTFIGSSTTISTTAITTDDCMIHLAKANATDALDIGIYAEYKPSSTILFGGLFRDATDGLWKFFKDSETEPTTTVNEAATGYAYAPIKASGAIFTAPAGSSASTNYVTWNGSTGAIEYRSLPSTMVTGSLTAGRVTLSSGTYAIADDALLLFDTTAKVLYQNCGQRWAYADKTTTYTLASTDFVVTTSGATSFSITIPTALFAYVGTVWIIKQNGTGTITLDPEGTQTIDGALTYILPGQYTSVIIQITSSTTISIL